jgi:hypothetical protein
MTYQEEIDTKILEVVNDSGFSRARESGLSDENKSWVACLDTCFYNEFSNVSCASYEQNPASDLCHCLRISFQREQCLKKLGVKKIESPIYRGILTWVVMFLWVKHARVKPVVFSWRGRMRNFKVLMLFDN